MEGLQSGGVLGGEMDFRFAGDPFSGGLGAFEIEACGEFLPGLVEGVVDLLLVHFGDDVE